MIFPTWWMMERSRCCGSLYTVRSRCMRQSCAFVLAQANVVVGVAVLSYAEAGFLLRCRKRDALLFLPSINLDIE